jgi:hypothetical protein
MISGDKNCETAYTIGLLCDQIEEKLRASN